jgi:outer membrane receptor protein involved in Fe transport
MKTSKKLIGLALLAPVCVFAQDTTSEDEQVFELSPFTVDSSKDSGYVASQTLAGTRLATSLRDAPSPVTVLTMEFLEDIDATDINEALTFVPAVDGDPRGYNSLNNNPVSTRIRGFQQTQNNQNFFQSRVTIDRYNIDRIEVNRGPNAILFGIGNPGGLYTASTKNAELKDNFGWAENRLDTHDSWRFAGDYNQVLIEDKLAVRIAGLTEDRKGFIDPMSDRDERFYIALNAQLLRKDNYDLGVRYQYENISNTATTRAWNMPWDNITAWQEAGGATWHPSDPAWPAGSRQMPNAFTISVPTNGSLGDVSAFSYGNLPTSAQSRTENNQRYRIGSPYSKAVHPVTLEPLPLDISYQGPQWGFALDADSHAIFVEQTFFKRIFTEFAYYRQDTDRDWNRSNGGQDLYVDLLEVLPDGTPNPNVGQIFTQGHFRVQRQHREIEVTRFTAGYELDLTDTSQWLGRHRFGLLLERSRDLLGLNDYVDVNLNTVHWANNLTAFGNRVVRRNYLFTGAGNVWEYQGNPSGDSYYPLSGIPGDGSVRDAANPYQTGLANFRISRGETETDSWVFSMQSFFLNDRLVSFWGIRGDDQVSTQLDPDALAASRDKGIYPDWWTLPTYEALTFKDETLTWGLIGRITPNIDLFYNSSEVLSPGSSRQDIYGEAVPASTGEGWDAGVRFNLLDSKLIGSISYYEATQLNIPVFNTLGGTDGQALNNFLEGLIELQEGGDPNVPDLNPDYEARKVTAVNIIDTFDNDASGIDIELTYNPTANWRISFRAAKTINEESNVNDRSFNYLEEFIFPMESSLAGLGDTLIPGTGDTVAQFYDDLDEEIAREKDSREGVLAQRLPKWSWTFVTNYNFREGRLKGFSIGGNVRYVSKLHVQALLDPDTGAFTGDYVFSDDRYVFALNAGYYKRFSNGVSMNIRINISNLFDDDSPAVHAANANTGEIIGIRPFEGRAASITTTFRF